LQQYTGILYYRILHITLALAVLLSTTGIPVHRHFCRGSLMGIAIFLKPRGCEKTKHKACHAGGHCAKKKAGNCCKDKSEYHQSDQDKQLTPAHFKPLKQPVFPALPWPAFLAPVSAHNHTEVLPYLHYRPPLIRSNFQVLLQVFRF